MGMDEKTYTRFMKLAISCQAFYNAAQILWLDYNQDSIEKVFPCIVNTAFCSELSLKALLAKSGYGFKRGHKLYELFLLLPPEAQNCIIKILQVLHYPNMETEWLLNEIKLVSDYFYKVRYALDFTLLIDITFSKNLMEVLFFIEQEICGRFAMTPCDSILSKEEEMEVDNRINEAVKDMIQEADEAIAKKIKGKLK